MKTIKVGCLAIGLTIWPYIVIWLLFFEYRSGSNGMLGIHFVHAALFSWIAAFFLAIYGVFYATGKAVGATKLQSWAGLALCLAVLCFQMVVVCIYIWRSYHLGDYLTRAFGYDHVA